MSLSAVGIVHTFFGLLALFTATRLIVKHRHIDTRQGEGKTYVVATAITAITALFIFNHGGFNQAHGLALLTLFALLAGVLLNFFRLFGRLTPYIQLTALSSTLLFHLIPAATEILTRFPLNDPKVKSFDDPLLHQTFLIILVLFLVLLTWQLLWLKRRHHYIN